MTADVPGSPAPFPPPGQRGRGVRWAAVGTVAVAFVALGTITAVQAGRIDRLQESLAETDAAHASAASASDKRLGSMENRLAAVEEKNQQLFDPQAVAASVLPSVFQVIADDFTGSAFAIGTSPEAGRTNVLTAFHVVAAVWDRNGKTVQLERDGKRYSAVIADVDRTRDIALLHMDATATGLSAASGFPASGESILAVGAPLGLTQSITTGVVSAVRDPTDAKTSIIQFDAPINPGNSGGPVINTRKEVVGIADAKLRDAEGIGLAVPIQAACQTFHVC
jgi:putative serine protease PepD